MAEYWTEVEDWPVFGTCAGQIPKPVQRMSDDEARARLASLEEALAAKEFGSKEPDSAEARAA